MVETEHPMYDFDRAIEPLHGLPPIVGRDGSSTWLRTPAHVRLARLPLPSTLDDHLVVAADTHLDSRAEQVVLGTSRSSGTALVLRVNTDGVPGRVSFLLRDEDGRTLEAHADGSRSIARRLVVSAKPAENSVDFYEIQPWASPNPALPLVTCPTVRESPARFAFDAAAALGGFYEDDVLRGPFGGRIGEVFIATGEPHVLALAACSSNPTGLSHAALRDPSAEHLDVFRRGLRRLRSWTSGPMSVDDMGDASILLWSWLFDRKTPVLVRLARGYGVQLWMPGPSERARRYEEAVLASGPVVLVQGGTGPESPMGFSWLTLEEWQRTPVLHAQGHAVSARDFIRFVRNKLGAGHFDETQRDEPQKRLLEVTTGLELGNEGALEFQMRHLASQVLLATSVARLEAIAGS